MVESVTNSPPKRYAVVTGANKGIGLEICRQLASIYGITVVLTARDEKRGYEAVGKLKECEGLSDDLLIFHQLDVADPTSVDSFAGFIRTKFGRLDILVNNAGIPGVAIDGDAFKARMAEIDGVTGRLDKHSFRFFGLLSAIQEYSLLVCVAVVFRQARESVCVIFKPVDQLNWDGIITQTYEYAEQCLQTNYYGAKRMIESLIPLLQLSTSPRIVNVSSETGKLKNIPNEWAKKVLNDEQNLTEESVEEVLKEYLKDFKEGSAEAKGWPSFMSAYTVAKAAMNAYTRILAKKYPTFCINAVCPGFVKTDINFNMGILTVEQGAESAVKLVVLPNSGPSGLFFIRGDISSF